MKQEPAWIVVASLLSLREYKNVFEPPNKIGLDKKFSIKYRAIKCMAAILAPAHDNMDNNYSIIIIIIKIKNLIKLL